MVCDFFFYSTFSLWFCCFNPVVSLNDSYKNELNSILSRKERQFAKKKKKNGQNHKGFFFFPIIIVPMLIKFFGIWQIILNFSLKMVVLCQTSWLSRYSILLLDFEFFKFWSNEEFLSVVWKLMFYRIPRYVKEFQMLSR